MDGLGHGMTYGYHFFDGCLFLKFLYGWMLMDVSPMDGWLSHIYRSCRCFRSAGEDLLRRSKLQQSHHQHHQRQIEPTRCQLEDLTQDDYFNGENMRNHWIGLRENLNRKPSFLPSNWLGFPVSIFPSSNSMKKMMINKYIHMAVCQNLVPLVNIKIAGKWMFIPLKMVLIGIDPYPHMT